MKQTSRNLLDSYLWRVQYLFFVFFFVVFTLISSPVFSAQKLPRNPKLNTAFDSADTLAQWIAEMMVKNGGTLSAADATLLNDCLVGQTYRMAGNYGSIVIELDLTHRSPHYHIAFIPKSYQGRSVHDLIPGAHPLHHIPADPKDYSKFPGPNTPLIKSKTRNCTPSEISEKLNNSAPKTQSPKATPAGTGSGTGRGYPKGYGTVRPLGLRALYKGVSTGLTVVNISQWITDPATKLADEAIQKAAITTVTTPLMIPTSAAVIGASSIAGQNANQKLQGMLWEQTEEVRRAKNRLNGPKDRGVAIDPEDFFENLEDFETAFGQGP